MRVLLCEASLRVSFFVHVNMSDSENLSEEMWEETIDSGGLSEISSPESSSDDYSDHVEVAKEDANVIRGAEPYRFEPLARPCRVVEQDAPYSKVFCTYLHCI